VFKPSKELKSQVMGEVEIPTPMPEPVGT
jgi:hypothetical protein